MTWNKAIKDVSELYSEYSVADISTSLFCSEMWLPNIASSVKYLFWWGVFLSLPQEYFRLKNRINTYQDFKVFVKKLYILYPDYFMILEDYIPEQDWGEIKFYFDECNYKIFYGCLIEPIYDYLIGFQITHCQFDDEYLQIVRRSPCSELKAFLILQDYIIKNIKQERDDTYEKIIKRYIEVPSKKFWVNSCNFIESLKIDELVSRSDILNYIITLGDFSFPKTEEEFGNIFFNDLILPFCFFNFKGNILPISPRRLSWVLIDTWANILKSNSEKLLALDSNLNIKARRAFFQYIRARYNEEHFYPAVSAVLVSGKPYNFLFDVFILCKENLYLIYWLDIFNTNLDLKSIFKKIDDSVSMIVKSHLTVALYSRMENVQFHPIESKMKIIPCPIVVMNNISTHSLKFEIPHDFSGQVLSLQDFLAIIDELEDINGLKSFFNFFDAQSFRMSPVSWLDRLGFYLDSNGIISTGVESFDMIFINPHWGNNLRYITLKKFWDLYPESHYFDHPRSWRIEVESEHCIRLISRGYLGSALYSVNNQVHFFFSAPFREFNYKKCQIADLLMQCLEDSLHRVKQYLSEIDIVSCCSKVNCLFFPKSLVENEDKFNHLRHLLPVNGLWSFDSTFLIADVLGVRFVFDESMVIKTFEETEDASLEEQILLDFLNAIEQSFPGLKISNIREKILSVFAQRKPRYKFHRTPVDVDFPEFVDRIISPEEGDFKLSYKKLSEIVHTLSITPGRYDLLEARDKVNSIRQQLIELINSELIRINFKAEIKNILCQVDCVIHKFSMEYQFLANSLKLDVDYSREDKYKNDHKKFVLIYRSYRYLIEKFVQLSPKGTERLMDDKLRFILALINELYQIQNISDLLHYGIHPIALSISERFQFEVINDSDIEKRENYFSGKQSQYALGLIGTPDDRVNCKNDFKTILNRLADPLQNILGFNIEDMCLVCHVLSKWAGFSQSSDVNCFYCASLDELISVCQNNIDSIDQESINRIIDFLVLDPRSILRVAGEELNSFDLPIWEIAKRPNRYILKPLIHIDDIYYWGPYSVKKTANLWIQRLSSNTTPYQMNDPKVDKILHELQAESSELLVNKAFEVAGRFTKYREKNLFLHSRFPGKDFPYDLGDYDVFVYIQDRDVIINIECKDLLETYCLKDAQRLRNNIFGDDRDRKSIGKIEKREAFLRDRYSKVFSFLDWPCPSDEVKVISIFLSRYLYWASVFPPYNTKVEFLRIDELNNFINDL